VGSGVVIVTWDTNISATSQVIYGLASNGPYNINMSANNFGYTYGTPEQDLDPNKVTSHFVTISGLTPGNYVYRVVSKASPATVGYEYQFTVPTSSASPAVAFGEGGGVSGGAIGEILGASAENNGTSTATITNASSSSENILRNNLAAAFAAGWFSWWWLWIIILLILLALGLYIYNKRKQS
jgi:hypothetical protein